MRECRKDRYSLPYDWLTDIYGCIGGEPIEVQTLDEALQRLREIRDKTMFLACLDFDDGSTLYLFMKDGEILGATLLPSFIDNDVYGNAAVEAAKHAKGPIEVWVAPLSKERIEEMKREHRECLG